MLRSTVCTASLLLTSFQWAHAGELRSPLRVQVVSAVPDTLQVSVELAALGALASSEQVLLRGVALDAETTVDLSLERLDVARRRLEFYVDGAPAPGLTDGLQLSVWSGHVLGAAKSEVMLSFSNVGCRGWVRRDGALHHLIPDGAGLRAKWVSEATLLRAGAVPAHGCEQESLASNAPTMVAPTATSAGAPHFLTTSLYECKVSVETDYQLNQVFGGDVVAESAYVTSLLTWVSYRYEEQIQTVLTYPYVNFWTTASDPWVSGDNGAGSVNMLYEFQAAWQFNVPNGGNLGAFLGGAGLGGGVAWRPGLCNDPYNFSVSGNINGQVPFPVTQGPSNWDFMVVAHEIGHNFNSPHTHNYCPPLDECAPAGNFGSCQTQQVCTNQGTLMSYCHLCSGGLANVTTYFHPQNVADMRAWVESTCLPFYCNDPLTYCVGKPNSQGCTPAISYSGHPTLSGLDDFHVRCANVINQKNGLLYWGYAPMNAPFQGGTKCVLSPVVRTPAQLSGGTLGGSDCSGQYDTPLSHAYMASHGFSAGTTIYAQYWMRDPASASTTGLSNGLQVTICN